MFVFVTYSLQIVFLSLFLDMEQDTTLDHESEIVVACHPPAVPLPPKFYELRDSWIIYNNTKAFCISGEWDLRPANQRGQHLMSFIERLKPWYTENV